MSFEDWIREAASLGGEGIEHYDGFFRSLSPEDVDPIARALDETEQITSMICFSPDFTHAVAAERERQVERQKAAIDLTARLGARHCRTLTAAFSPPDPPGVYRADARRSGRRSSTPSAAGRALNGNQLQRRTWRYPSSRSGGHFSRNHRAYRFTHFGVQYDHPTPSSAGYDPNASSEMRHRVRTMTGSDAILRPARAGRSSGRRRRTGSGPLITVKRAKGSTTTMRSSPFGGGDSAAGFRG